MQCRYLYVAVSKIDRNVGMLSFSYRCVVLVHTIHTLPSFGMVVSIMIRRVHLRPWILFWAGGRLFCSSLYFMFFLTLLILITVTFELIIYAVQKVVEYIVVLAVVCFWHDSPPVDQGLLIHEVSRAHNDAPQSVGLLWTSDQPVAETSTWQHTTLTTDKHSWPRWNSNPQSQQASGRRPTP